MGKREASSPRGAPINPTSAPQGTPLQKKSWQTATKKPNQNEKPKRAKPPPADGGYMQKQETVTTASGEQYFIMGKNRIKITEHFPSDGRPIEELITDLIIHKIKEKR